MNEIERIIKHWETNDGTCGYCMVDLLQDGAEHHELCFFPALHEAVREIERLRGIIAIAKEMRYYCLGRDVSTQNLIACFDAALAEESE